jgi:hypothetical protein
MFIMPELTEEQQVELTRWKNQCGKEWRNRLHDLWMHMLDYENQVLEAIAQNAWNEVARSSGVKQWESFSWV